MKLVIVSSALPRRCGIASFTDDLRQALADITGWNVSVCGIDRDNLPYGPEVDFTIRQDDAEDYRATARAIAGAGADLVLIQHEFGIFGGLDGAFVLELADELRLHGVRYAVTLHTVLSQPSSSQRAALAALCSGAHRVTVFAHEGRRLAITTGVAPADRISVVPHGAPAVLRSEVPHHRLTPVVTQTLGALSDSRVITTFGLVGPGKGLEHGIAALAKVSAWHPDAIYLIAGATHPEIIRHSGETYRQQLKQLAAELGIASQVWFLDSFLSEEELSAILGRTDVFVTPYRSPEQISSGALTFAIAAGRPVVSTAYLYAKEMLAPDSQGKSPGVLVPCSDSDALAQAITDLLSDPAALASAQEAADRLGATLTWPAVAKTYSTILAGAHTSGSIVSATLDRAPIRLTHLHHMVNSVGIVQFAKGTEPDLESGYCVDDMARLGVVAAGLHALAPSRHRCQDWLIKSMHMMEQAIDERGMHNVMDQSGRWLDQPHLGDHIGRTIWSAGTVAAAPGVSHGNRIEALTLLRRTAGLLELMDSPNSLAYGILGLTQWPLAELESALWLAATKLAFTQNQDANWPWFGQRLTYDNARLPQALIEAGVVLGDDDLTRRGLTALRWYLTQVGLDPASNGAAQVLRLVGNCWRERATGRRAAEGDEQPIDAAAVVEACITALRHTSNHRYAAMARDAFRWFYGANRAGTPLYGPTSGGCRDGLFASGASENQGAESTLAYYQALLAMRHYGLLASPAAPVMRPSRHLTAAELVQTAGKQ